MPVLSTDHPLAVAAVTSIRTGDVERLRQLLAEHPELAGTGIGDREVSRTLLHVVTDWPGHVPSGPAVVRLLVEAGAVVDAPFHGSHVETPLHWAASCDDVAVLDALLDAGADIEAPGAVVGGGTPLADACAFGQWQAADRLVERGAHVVLHQAATLGLLNRLNDLLAVDPAPEEIDRAFWGACHGGQRACAEVLLDRGAAIDWLPPWERATPLDAAQREGAVDLVSWLRARGAHAAVEP